MPEMTQCLFEGMGNKRHSTWEVIRHVANIFVCTMENISNVVQMET